MGLFDFFRHDAGKRIGSSDTPTPADLKQEIGRLGFDAANLDIQINGETAVLRGVVASQEQREKIMLAVGNVRGIAKVDDQMAVTDAAASGAAGSGPAGSAGTASASATPEQVEFYTVKPGDTLSKIAKEVYHNPNKYPAIFEANRPMLKDPDEIYPGQVLRIPKAA